jgi:hypothetical protein
MTRILCVLLGGCYMYVAPERPTALAGREIQLSLTDAGAVALAPVIGPAAESVAGKVVEDRRDAIVLALENVHHRDGQAVRWRGERVAVDRAFVSTAGERVFSPVRTAFFSGIVGTALVVARQAFGGQGRGGGGVGVGQSGSPR